MLARLLPFRSPFRRRPAIAAAGIDGTTEVDVQSWLRATAYFHWWLNGIYLGRTQDGISPFPTGSQTLRPDEGEQCFLQVFDTRDPNYDPRTFLVLAAPGRRTFEWIQSLDPTCAGYLVQQQSGSTGSYPVGGSAWQTIAQLTAHATTWQYTFTTDPLADLTQYAWQVVPIDIAGRPGTPIAISPEIIVCTPPAPSFTAAIAGGNLTIEAA